MPPTHTNNSASSSHDAKLHDENSDVLVKTEIPEDLELNDTEAHRYLFFCYVSQLLGVDWALCFWLVCVFNHLSVHIH